MFWRFGFSKVSKIGEIIARPVRGRAWEGRGRRRRKEAMHVCASLSSVPVFSFFFLFFFPLAIFPILSLHFLPFLLTPVPARTSPWRRF